MQALFGLFTGAGATAAPAAATTAAAAAPAAAGGLSLSSLLSGGATVLSMVASMQAADAQAQAYEAQAVDAQMEKPLELVQGLERKNQIRRATAQAVNDLDTANAASSVDLSFGTPAQARKQAFREGDYAENSNAWTTGSTLDRLDYKTKEYLRMASRARSAGMFDAFATGLTGFAKLSSIG